MLAADQNENRSPIHLFEREGVFHARIVHPGIGEPFEIALHGVGSEIEARAALQYITDARPHPTLVLPVEATTPEVGV